MTPEDEVGGRDVELWRCCRKTLVPADSGRGLAETTYGMQRVRAKATADRASRLRGGRHWAGGVVEGG